MAERRPRIPGDLAERVDVARGDVPFERWVRRAVEQALGTGGTPGGAPRPSAEAVTAPTPAESPLGSLDLFRCPDDCDPSWRTHSYLMRCPKCRCKVVPA
jgi:hypothetical protein